MTILQSIILGIVEGLTEFLPISSTGHMILASALMKIAETDFLKTFEIVIQLGAILAVVVLYYKKFFNIKLLTNLFVAFLPTGIIGLLLFKHIKVWLANPMIVIYSLFIGGIVILLVEKWYAGKKEEINTKEIKDLNCKESFILGLCQSISMIPGVSRSGAIIIGGLLMKLRRDTLTEFTFLLAVPTMFVATVYTIYKSYGTLTVSNSLTPLLIGFVISFIVAMVVIKWFLGFIRKNDFKVFGYYRIVIAVIAYFILF